MPTTTLSNVRVALQIAADLVTSLFRGAVNHQVSQTFTIGSAAGNVQKIYSSDFVVVNSGTPTTFDLTSLLDPGAGAVTFAFVTHIIIENLSTTTAEIMTVMGGTNGLQATSTNPLQPNGGVWVMCNPNPGITVDGTHKIVNLAVASGTNVSGKITILGR